MRTEGHFKNYGVGQGGFYVGKINNEFTFVYDCGANPDDQLPKTISLAKYELLEEKKIDMLVLSHFDIDHINGLKYLLETHYVESLYIPFVHPDILIFLKYLFISIGISMRNIKNIYLVSSTPELEEGELNNLDEYYSNTKAYIISDKITIYFSNVWEFYFKELVVNDAKNKIKEIIEKCKNIEQNHESTSDSVEELKNCFKEVFKCEFEKNDFSNLISLFMYHKPSESLAYNIKARILINHKSPLCYPYRQHFFDARYYEFISIMDSGTLLTGDGNLKKSSSILNNFENWGNNTKIFDNLLIMDLPHHGSNKNIDKEFFIKNFSLKKDILFLLSNSGLGNQYKHPNQEIVKLAISYSSMYIASNESISFEYIISTY